MLLSVHGAAFSQTGDAQTKMAADCAKGTMSSCSAVAVQLIEPKDRKGRWRVIDANARQRAQYLFKQACDKGDVTGCEYRGISLAGLRSPKVDIEQGRSLLEYSCKKKSGRACYFLGRIYRSSSMSLSDSVAQLQSDGGLEFKYVSLACDNRFERGCYAMAKFFLSGQVVKQDSKRAVGLYERSCKNGDADGCLRLFEFYRVPLSYMPKRENFGIVPDKCKSLYFARAADQIYKQIGVEPPSSIDGAVSDGRSECLN